MSKKIRISKKIESAAYASSLLQQNFGESIEKGYLVWDIETCQHVRRFILNDYGYCKINIYKGEIWEDRLQDLKFSLNKKKTKIEVIIHDDKENYSVEKLSQIEKFIKDRHGCESVSADFQSIDREIGENENSDSEEIDVNNTESAEKLLTEFLDKNNFDNTEDVIELSRDIDKKLNVKQNPTHGMRIEFNSLEVSNLLAFPVIPVFFDFDKLNGITGIFGPNYNGKSNIMKVFCWVLYGKMPGDIESPKLVNLYTNINKAWGKIHFTIAGIKYYAHRGVTVKKKKDGTPDVSFQIEYKKQANVKNELTDEYELKWVDVESEEAATEKKEKKKLITDYIGTYEDFMVCAIQADKQDYLSLSQQPKNDLINKFLGLEVYREKYDLANDTFKTTKAKQKVLGDPVELDTQIKDFDVKINAEKSTLKTLHQEKDENNNKIDDFNKKILESTQKLHKIEVPEETNVETINGKISTLNSKIENEKIISEEKELWIKGNFKKELSSELASIDISSIKEKNVETIKTKIETVKISIESEKFKLVEKEKWLEENFKKDISENLKSIDKVQVEKELNEERSKFNSEKLEFVEIEKWIKENPTKTITEQEPIEKKIADYRVAIVALGNKLKIAKGEKCPTCDHVKHEANPAMETKCRGDIERGEKALKEAIDNLAQIKKDVEHNAKHERQTSKIDSLKISIQARQKNVQTLKNNLELSLQKEEIVKHNKKIDEEANVAKEIKGLIIIKEVEIVQLQSDIDSIEKYAKKKAIILHNSKVDEETESLKTIKESITTKEKTISELKEQIKALESNKVFILENIKINESINSNQEEIKVYKIMNLQVDGKIKESSGNVGAWNNNVENLSEKLNSIRETDRIYKKYSVYLQAVGRDGIPAMIIKKKLPIINHKINSLLKSMVAFKVEMNINLKGDVKEVFYFSENKMDTLPIGSGSGSVKFIASTAISDALHYVSSLIKPSLKVIDEGFDTLDNKKLVELNSMFNYLKSKYKNIFIVTHKSEVRDYVDNIIEVEKTKDGITDPEVLLNAEAGISKFVYS
jgi:exonuclease SbcC